MFKGVIAAAASQIIIPDEEVLRRFWTGWTPPDQAAAIPAEGVVIDHLPYPDALYAWVRALEPREVPLLERVMTSRAPHTTGSYVWTMSAPTEPWSIGFTMGTNGARTHTTMTGAA